MWLTRHFPIWPQCHFSPHSGPAWLNCSHVFKCAPGISFAPELWLTPPHHSGLRLDVTFFRKPSNHIHPSRLVRNPVVTWSNFPSFSIASLIGIAAWKAATTSQYLSPSRPISSPDSFRKPSGEWKRDCLWVRMPLAQVPPLPLPSTTLHTSFCLCEPHFPL